LRLSSWYISKSSQTKKREKEKNSKSIMISSIDDLQMINILNKENDNDKEDLNKSLNCCFTILS